MAAKSVALAVFATTSVHAQRQTHDVQHDVQADSDTVAHVPVHAPPAFVRSNATRWVVWAGGALHSPFASVAGPRSDYRDFFMLGIRIVWPVLEGRAVALEYSPDLIPLAVVGHDPDYVPFSPANACPSGSACYEKPAGDSITTHATAYGFGLAPAGIQLRLFAHSPVAIVLNANGGVLWLDRRLPEPGGTQLNFTAAAGGALQIRCTTRSAVLLGYLFHHTSNARTGSVNPGFDSHFAYVGFGVLR